MKLLERLRSRISRAYMRAALSQLTERRAQLRELRDSEIPRMQRTVALQLECLDFDIAYLQRRLDKK